MYWRRLLPGIEQPLQSRVADAEFLSSLPAGKPSCTEALHHLSELLRKLGALIHSGPADALALPPRPLHALVLSDRTVQRHIADIYDKIGARNRSEATAFVMSQLDLPGQSRLIIILKLI